MTSSSISMYICVWLLDNNQTAPNNSPIYQLTLHVRNKFRLIAPKPSLYERVVPNSKIKPTKQLLMHYKLKPQTKKWMNREKKVHLIIHN